jgi:pimeloyl-ACP methyl ester carboxylesterase
VPKRRWLVFAGVAAALIALGIGWRRYDRENVGIPDFYLWKALSGKAHGGRRADMDGVTIYYETYGKGPPVLVLHGGTAFIETMHYQIADLASDHLVIAPDSRGHGRSTDGPGPLHYADMAGDMIALMDRLHVAKADVVGWSDGGIIALDLAMRHPDRIGRVVTIGANFDVSGLVDPTAAPAADSATVAGRRDFYRSVSPTPARWPVFYAKVVQMWRTEPRYTPADLGRIRGPVLVIAGEHDGIRRDHTDALAHAIPGAQEVIIPNASHMAPLEDPKRVDAAIRGFLAGRGERAL